MATNNSGEAAAPPRRTFGQRAKRAGLFLLFGTILLIPRLRRLRRRVWAWTIVRLAMAGCGGWLIWRFVQARAGVAALVCGVLLLAGGLLIRANPARKSLDAMARELGALIVLNGGVFRQSPDSAPVPHASILVQPEQITVMGSADRRLLEIPLARVRRLEARPVTAGDRNGEAPWEVEIQWMAEAPCTARFQYEGVFAEHLARVAESTLRGQWKKELPVLS